MTSVRKVIIMQSNFIRRAGVLTLCLCMLILSACSSNSEDSDEASGADDTEAMAVTGTSTSDGAFGLSYISGEGLNPYSVSSSTNLSLVGLIYDYLFTVDERFEASPRICESYTYNEDFTQYTFTIKPDIKFSNGADLTVSDVIYSLTCAGNSTQYSDRLSLVTDISIAKDDSGEEIPDAFTITLSKAHGNLPVLLNLPIIEYNSAGQSYPAGTGPYVFSNDGAAPCLIANSYYWDGDPPIDTIELISTENTTEAFSSGELDLVSIDLTSSSFSSNVDQDIRSYNTSIMGYIGFNMSTVPNAGVRQAINRAINRESVITSALGGNCTSSALPIHPSLSHYSETLNKQYSWDVDAAASILDEIQDINFDLSAYEERTPATWLYLDLLVCTDSTSVYESANLIAQNLSALGIEVTVVGKGYEDYIAALNSGSFDMYYAQVKLQSDFDLSGLLTDSASINYGHVTGGAYSALIRQYLAASSEQRAQSAEEMCAYIMENAPISVIGFKQLSVITRQDTVSGMNPVQDNIFSNITDWIISV